MRSLSQSQQKARAETKPASAPLYATVCLMNGTRWYSNFSTDLDSLLAYAERSPGVIAIELAHGGEPPVWTRNP